MRRRLVALGALALVAAAIVAGLSISLGSGDSGPAAALPDAPPQGEAVLGSSGQPATARAQALLAGQRLTQLGFNATLAPLADVDTPGGPLNGRLFSTDPRAVARFTAAAVAGYRA